MKTRLRLATVSDAVLVADISRQSFYETFAADNTPEDMQLFLDKQFTRGKLILEVGRPEHEFFLAEWQGEVAGYLKLRYGGGHPLLKEHPSLEIARIYCLKKFIGKGIGKLMMEKAMERAADRNIAVVWLGVWERNQRAIDFYSAFGFEKFGEHDFLLGKDLQRDWLMKKLL